MVIFSVRYTIPIESTKKVYFYGACKEGESTVKQKNLLFSDGSRFPIMFH